MVDTRIEHAMATYTGGGLYIYYGKLLDGNYFIAYDDWECIEICSVDTNCEESGYAEFYEKYRVEMLVGKEYEVFWNEMLLWIIKNEPKGNYLDGDLKDRLIKDNNEDDNCEDVIQSFTEEELCILSDEMLALIKCTSEAMKLIYDVDNLNALQKTLEKYQKLNKKVCGITE